MSNRNGTSGDQDNINAHDIFSGLLKVRQKTLQTLHEQGFEVQQPDAKMLELSMLVELTKPNKDEDVINLNEFTIQELLEIIRSDGIQPPRRGKMTDTVYKSLLINKVTRDHRPPCISRNQIESRFGKNAKVRLETRVDKINSILK